MKILSSSIEVEYKGEQYSRNMYGRPNEFSGLVTWHKLYSGKNLHTDNPENKKLVDELNEAFSKITLEEHQRNNGALV